MMDDDQEHRYGLYRRDDPLGALTFTTVESDTEEGAWLALRTIAGDAAEAGEDFQRHAIWDQEERKWVSWPWPCPGCRGSTDAPGLCADCRSDRSLGDPIGQTRRDVERETADDRARRERDVWEPRHVR